MNKKLQDKLNNQEHQLLELKNNVKTLQAQMSDILYKQSIDEARSKIQKAIKNNLDYVVIELNQINEEKQREIVGELEKEFFNNLRAPVEKDIRLTDVYAFNGWSYIEHGYCFLLKSRKRVKK